MKIVKFGFDGFFSQKISTVISVYIFFSMLAVILVPVQERLTCIKNDNSCNVVYYTFISKDVEQLYPLKMTQFLTKVSDIKDIDIEVQSRVIRGKTQADSNNMFIPRIYAKETVQIFKYNTRDLHKAVYMVNQLKNFMNRMSIREITIASDDSGTVLLLVELFIFFALLVLPLLFRETQDLKVQESSFKKNKYLNQ